MPEITVGFEIGYSAGWLDIAVDEKSAAIRILRQFYPGPAKCTVCGEPIQGRRPLETFWRGKRTWCKSCGSKFNPLAGTVLAGTQLTFKQHEVLRFCYFLPRISDEQRFMLALDLTGLDPKTIRGWFSKIKFWESAGA